jgi:hypothetical protein
VVVVGLDLGEMKMSCSRIVFFSAESHVYTYYYSSWKKCYKKFIAIAALKLEEIMR